MRAFAQSRALIVFFILAVVVALISMAIRATDPAALGEALRTMFAANQKADIITGIQYSLETPVLWNAILFPGRCRGAVYLGSEASGFGCLLSPHSLPWLVFSLSPWLRVAVWQRSRPQ